MIKNIFPLLLSLLALLGISSCRKTIGLEPLAQNKILEYKITNISDAEMFGVIDNTDNTITVYAPYYYGLDLIDPEIKVSPGAKLTEKVLPVNVKNNTHTYTVQGADGSTNTYKLIIIQQNTPSLSIFWGAIYSGSIDPSKLIGYPNANLPGIIGDFNSSNPALVDLTLINQLTKKEVKVGKEGQTLYLPIQSPVYELGAVVPADIDTGKYIATVNYLGHKESLKEPIHIIHRQPNVAFSTKEVKQGETISFAAVYSVLLNLKSMSAEIEGLGKFDLPIVSYTPLEMVIRIPENFPVGNYQYNITYTAKFEGWKDVSRIANLIVKPK